MLGHKRPFFLQFFLFFRKNQLLLFCLLNRTLLCHQFNYVCFMHCCYPLVNFLRLFNFPLDEIVLRNILSYNTHLFAKFKMFFVYPLLILKLFTFRLSFFVFTKFLVFWNIWIISVSIDQNMRGWSIAQIYFWLLDTQNIKVFTRQRFEQQYQNFTRVQALYTLRKFDLLS